MVKMFALQCEDQSLSPLKKTHGGPPVISVPEEEDRGSPENVSDISHSDKLWV